MTPERFARLRSILAQRQPDLTVLMDRVHKAHNLSAVIRVCDAVGVLEAHAVVPETGLELPRHVSAGTWRWVRMHTHESAVPAIEHLRGRGFQLLVADPRPEARDFREVDYTRATALILGTELYGVSPQALAAADALVRIPMKGLVTSLNVSVAAAIILFEAQRQRIAAGLYDSPRLDRETLERTLFEWAYPRLARHCRKRGAPYPRLSPEGEILGSLPR